MAATRVLPLRAAASARVAGTVRIEFLTDKTRVLLALSKDAEPYTAFLADQNPAAPALARLSAVNGGYLGACQSMSDVSALVVCAADGRIIYEANRTLPANRMEALRRACRAAHFQSAAPSPMQQRVMPASAPAPVAQQLVSAPIDPLPPPKSEALSDILTIAKQLFPEPEPPALPPATKKSAGHSPSRGVRRSYARGQEKSTLPDKTLTERQLMERQLMERQLMERQRPPLSMPFPQEDMFAAGFAMPHTSNAQYSAQYPSARPMPRAAPVLRGEKIPSPFPKTYPACLFYRVPLPFYRQPRDYCLIGLDGENGTVYALPVGEDNKKLPPLCTGAALRRGTDGVMYAVIKL